MMRWASYEDERLWGFRMGRASGAWHWAGRSRFLSPALPARRVFGHRPGAAHAKREPVREPEHREVEDHGDDQEEHKALRTADESAETDEQRGQPGNENPGANTGGHAVECPFRSILRESPRFLPPVGADAPGPRGRSDECARSGIVPSGWPKYSEGERSIDCREVNGYSGSAACVSSRDERACGRPTRRARRSR